jgi:hypothetical protein
MFAFVESARERRKICDGRVDCPLRGADVDVDACIECDWVASIYRRGGDGFVRCRPDASSEGWAPIHQV